MGNSLTKVVQALTKFTDFDYVQPDFSRDLENPSPNLSRQLLQRGEPPQRTGSPTRREALISPPSLVGKGAGGLGLTLAFPHDVKSQMYNKLSVIKKKVSANLINLINRFITTSRIKFNSLAIAEEPPSISLILPVELVCS